MKITANLAGSAVCEVGAPMENRRMKLTSTESLSRIHAVSGQASVFGLLTESADHDRGRVAIFCTPSDVI
jgi:hypothetical protein